MSELLEAIKEMTMNVNEAGMPCAVMLGEVISVAPMQIQVEQKLILEEMHLILTQSVTGREETMTFSDATEPAGSRSHSHTVGERTSSTDNESAHTHRFAGEKTVRFHGELKVGDTVLLLRMQGGQKFVVLDKVVRPT